MTAPIRTRLPLPFYDRFDERIGQYADTLADTEAEFVWNYGQFLSGCEELEPRFHINNPDRALSVGKLAALTLACWALHRECFLATGAEPIDLKGGVRFEDEEQGG